MTSEVFSINGGYDDDDEDDDEDEDDDDEDDDDDGDDDDVIRSCALRSKCGYAQAFHSISLLDLFLIISHNSLPSSSSSPSSYSIIIITQVKRFQSICQF